jgi:hypothetical protein
MSRKDFIYLADCIRADRNHFDDTAIDVLIGFCSTINPQFNSELWLDYLNSKSGPRGGKVTR